MSSSRNKSYLLRMTEDEHAELQARAKAESMSMNDYVLNKALGSMPSSPGAYAALSSRLATVEKAMTLAGLDDHISQAQDMLRGRKQKEG